jgi:hypothetical protein
MKGGAEMKRIACVVLLVLGVACSGPSGDSGSAPSSPQAPSPKLTATLAKPPELATLDETLVILSTANIFGAGGDAPPGPGGGGGGTLPPGWRLPAGADRIVMFPSVTGSVNFWTGVAELNGPAGDMIHSTRVASYGGISGVVYQGNGGFLVGVFLTDAPAESAPPRLVFSQPPPTDLLPGDRLPKLRGDLMLPRIGQVFLIGDGKDYRYAVPSKATRLFVGFVDGRLWKGLPGFYGNNSGEMSATIALTQG